jgi:hypothetical protein
MTETHNINPNEKEPLMNEEIQTTEELATDDLMTPEEMAMLKKLQEKRKAQMKQMSSHKENLFQTLTSEFGQVMAKVKKDISTISTKNPLDDGNVYAITFGVESDDDEDSPIDSEAVAKELIEKHLSTIEPIMGISNSLKVSGTYEGQKLYWQIRKRA